MGSCGGMGAAGCAWSVYVLHGCLYGQGLGHAGHAVYAWCLHVHHAHSCAQTLISCQSRGSTAAIAAVWACITEPDVHMCTITHAGVGHAYQAISADVQGQVPSLLGSIRRRRRPSVLRRGGQHHQGMRLLHMPWVMPCAMGFILMLWEGWQCMRMQSILQHGFYTLVPCKGASMGRVLLMTSLSTGGLNLWMRCRHETLIAVCLKHQPLHA